MSWSQSAARWHLSRAVASHLEAVEALCRELQEVLRDRGGSAIGFAVELVARECLNNAVLHGNGSDASRQVALRVRCARKWICLQVSDEGPGFNWRQGRRQGLPAQPATSGRGLAIIQAYAARVRFNRAGNQITLWFPNQQQQNRKHQHG